MSNLIDSWNGQGPIYVVKFFNKIEHTVLSGDWSNADKVTVVILKLMGAIAMFLNSNEEVSW